MILPKTILDIQTGIPYDISWIAFGHVLGVSSPKDLQDTDFDVPTKGLSK